MIFPSLLAKANNTLNPGYKLAAGSAPPPLEKRRGCQLHSWKTRISASPGCLEDFSSWESHSLHPRLPPPPTTTIILQWSIPLNSGGLAGWEDG